MKAVLQIKPPEWMLIPQSMHLMSVLNASAQEPQALYVGGCVRNAVIGKPVADIDIATLLVPQEVQRRCAAAGIKTIPTGIEHGTVTALIDDQVYEITTLRRDVSTDGRRATVAFSNSWDEDVQRRDFTMNTLLADGDGLIYDLTGRGIEDLKAGRVVFVGDPHKRIEEDYLRILRFFRFHAFYGNDEPDQAALNACAAAAPHIMTLSRERVMQELLKILMSDHVARTLELMVTYGICADLPSSDYRPEDMDRLIEIERYWQKSDMAVRLYLLFQSCEGIEYGTKYLLYTNKQKKQLDELNKLWRECRSLAPKHVIYQYGKEAATRLFMFCAVKDSSFHSGDVMNLITTWDIPVFPINGHDAVSAGASQGAEIGRVLDHVERWWMDQDFLPDRSACLMQLHKLLR